MTCLTSPPKIRKTAFMRARNADMKAPPVPRLDRADATAAIQDHPEVDFATSTFRPTVHPVLAGLKQAQSMLAEARPPVVEILRDKLKSLYEEKSLGSFAENAEAAATVYQLAKDCRMDLIYDKQPVALSFSDDQRYKAGTFRLMTFGGKRKL